MKIPTEAQLRKRVEFWQQKLGPLGIAHWDIKELVVAEDEEDMPSGPAVASVFVPRHYDMFEIYFCAPQIELMADQHELDCTIVHELFHVAMRDLDEAINSAAEELHPRQAGEWGVRVHHERENLVDRAARAFVHVHGA
jgi:hypothetical protein